MIVNESLKHFTNVQSIIESHYDTRIEYYDKRRTYMIDELEHECEILSNKWKYIQEVLNDTIDLRKKTSKMICEMLETKHYTKIDDSYNYLIKMTMDSVSEESIQSLKNKYDVKQKQLEDLKNTTIQQMWYKDLQDLKESLEF